MHDRQQKIKAIARRKNPLRQQRVFARAAGIGGKLKYLRSGSGSSVERLRPNQGHQHLGNTRSVFEAHYELRHVTVAEPLLPEPLVDE